MPTNQPLTTADRGTIFMALAAWRERCKQEAAIMDEWSRDPKFNDATKAKCRRNAEASRAFEAEAAELLERI